MKIFLLFLGLVVKDTYSQEGPFGTTEPTFKVTVDGKAASTYQNCNCQCDSDTWTDGIAIRGNCERYVYKYSLVF